MLLVYDNITVSNPAFKKYWQINTFSTPTPAADGIDIAAEKGELKGNIRLSMLLPTPSDREVQILSGEEEMHQVFGVQYTPPSSTVQTQGSRVLFSLQAENEHDEFLTVMQMMDEKGEELPISHLEMEFAHIVVAGEHVIGFAKTATPINAEWSLDIPTDREYQVVLTGMAAGKWSIKQSDKEEWIDVAEGDSTMFFLGKGTCRLERLQE